MTQTREDPDTRRREIHEAVRAGVQEHAGWLRELRRDIHRYPEIAFQEERTAARLAQEMEELGLDVRTEVAGTGVVAALSGVAEPSREVECVAFRADMDALLMSEDTGLPYASERPRMMHACGHDAHSATVAAMARIVATSEALRRHLPGSLVFLFQPAEETGQGAKAMLEAGALATPEGAVDAVLGFHVHPPLRTGQLAVYPSYSHASADNFDVIFRGSGGHAGYPHLSRDPLPAAMDLIAELRALPAREVPPGSPAIVNVGSVQGGGTHNVIIDSVSIEGTFRTLDEEVREHLAERVQQLAEEYAEAHRVEVEVVRLKGSPALDNDPRLSEAFRREAVEVVGEEGVLEGKPGMGSEDFAYYTKELPAALFRLGCTPPEADTWYPLHSPRVQVDEASLELAARILLRSAYALLDEGFPPAMTGLAPPPKVTGAPA